MQKSRYILLVMLTFLLPGSRLCAQMDKEKATTGDSIYIRSYAEYLHLSLMYRTDNLRYRLSDASNARFIFSPNETYETVIGASYAFIDVEYSFSPRFVNINNQEDIKGKTKRSNIAFSFSFRRFYIKLEYGKATGFYLHNTADFDTDWKPGKPYTLFPSLQIKQTGGQLTYNINKRFSRLALKCGDEQQLKTAYTLLPTLYVYYFKIRDTDTAIKRGDDEQTRDWDMHISLPGAATFVFAKNWYCSVVAGPGIGLDMINSTLVNKDLKEETQRQTLVSVGYTARLAAGWSNRKYYAGVDAGLRNYAHINKGNETMQKLFYNASIYAGIRFNPPGVLKKSIDWVRRIKP